MLMIGASAQSPDRRILIKPNIKSSLCLNRVPKSELHLLHPERDSIKRGVEPIEPPRFTTIRALIMVSNYPPTSEAGRQVRAFPPP